MAITEPRGITIGKGTPQKLEGQNGDMTIRSSIRGLKLYVKESNKWHGVDLDIDLRSLVATIQRLEKEVKRLSNKTNNTPVVDKILLRQSGGSAAVAMQNKSGNIAFRNSTDSSDAKLQSIAFDTSTDNSSLKGWGQFYYDSTATNHIIESNGLVVNTTNGATSNEQAVCFLLSKAHDAVVRFQDGASGKYVLGYDYSDSGKFKINTSTSFADPSIFELDSNGVAVTGTLTASGDVTIGADADGTDRNITFGHSTLKTIMGIDDSADAFVINTDASYDGTLANNSFSIDASHNAIVAGSLTAASFNHFMDVKLHMFVTTDANQDYFPFGPSNIESHSTGDSLNDDTLFIPPYDGKLIKLVIHHGSSTGDAGATRINLRVNGSNKSFVQVTLSNETSATFDFTTLADDQISFSAGDRVRISADPATKLSYTTASSVWRYTI
tara:strand:- start:2230 stop:3549 length:1320 start_codon:yes stop_codon:yes gene_type:complete